MFIGVDILPCLAELQWNVILEYNIQVIWNLNTQLICLWFVDFEGFFFFSILSSALYELNDW